MDEDLKQNLSDEELRPHEKEYREEDGEVKLVDLGPKDTWDSEKPKIPEEDLKKCHKILMELTDRYKNRSVPGQTKVWEELQKVAEHQFRTQVGINAHVEIELITKFTATGRLAQLKLLREDSDTPVGYQIVDGHFVIPAYIDENVMINPIIVLDDWESVERKKEKAEQAIIERESRRAAGDSYFPTEKEVKGK